MEKSCDYVFAVDSLAMLDHAHTLQKLIEINRLAIFILSIHTPCYTLLVQASTPYTDSSVVS